MPPTGRELQLTKQIGEYLVAAELCRRGLIAATFTGSVPDYDIIASDKTGIARHVQVKANKSGDWQLSIDRFVKVTMDGDRQVLGDHRPPPIPGLVFVFLKLIGTSQDRFFIISWEDLQRVQIAGYAAYLKKKNGVRPRNPKSLHSSLSMKTLLPYEDNWKLILGE